jgi:hypothetical protein
MRPKAKRALTPPGKKRRKKQPLPAIWIFCRIKEQHGGERGEIGWQPAEPLF